MSRTRAALIALSLIPVLLVAGCSDDDPEPKFGPPSSGAPTSPTTSATSAAPTLDPEQTVEAWIAARNGALLDGDLTRVRALTSATCTSCNGILDPIGQVYNNGGTFDTDGWRVVASRIKSAKENRATVSTGLEFAAGRTIPKAGAEPVVYDSEKHLVTFRLTKSDGAWSVNFVGFLS